MAEQKMATLQDVADGANEESTPPEPFATWFNNLFGLDMAAVEGKNELTTTLDDHPVKVAGWYVSGRGWRFSVNNNNFSARGDLAQLPIEQRQREFLAFVRKAI